MIKRKFPLGAESSQNITKYRFTPFFKKNIFVLQSISAKRHFLKFIRVFFVLSITLTYTIFLGPTKVSAATISPVELSGSPTKDWRSISVSDDGTKIVAVNTNSLWTSSNSGSTWTVVGNDGYFLFRMWGTTSNSPTIITSLISSIFVSIPIIFSCFLLLG